MTWIQIPPRLSFQFISPTSWGLFQLSHSLLHSDLPNGVQANFAPCVSHSFMWHLRAVISSHQWVSYSAHNTYHNGANSDPKLTGMKIIIVREVMSLLISIIWISLLDKQAHWSHSTYTGSVSLASASLCSIFTHPNVLYELSRPGMLTRPSEVPAPGGNRHSAPH